MTARTNPDARIELLDFWKSGHTGFSAHNAVTVRANGYDGIERLARYLLRPPLALERLRLGPGPARYRRKQAARRVLRDLPSCRHGCWYMFRRHDWIWIVTGAC